MIKKRACVLLVLLLSVVSVFAASYKNNTYQKLAQEYTRKAQKALDAGEYDLAEEYARLAEENAALSEAFIKRMMAKNDADQGMALAKNRLDYCLSIHGDVNFPIAYEAGEKYFQQAQNSYDSEDYDSAAASSRKVIEALAEIHEIIPLPRFYIVRPWATTKDCFWNISGRPYIYNNPFLWENLYEANKSLLPKPEDPNLILPGMKMEIPSISGEYRDGVYSPDVDYEPFVAR